MQHRDEEVLVILDKLGVPVILYKMEDEESPITQDED